MRKAVLALPTRFLRDLAPGRVDFDTGRSNAESTALRRTGVATVRLALRLARSSGSFPLSAIASDCALGAPVAQSLRNDVTSRRLIGVDAHAAVDTSRKDTT